MFQCSDLSRCLTGDQHCDNRSQCADGSDEHNCCELYIVFYYCMYVDCILCSSVFVLVLYSTVCTCYCVCIIVVYCFV